MEHPQLQDGSRERWPAHVVAMFLADFVEKHSIQTVRPQGMGLGIRVARRVGGGALASPRDSPSSLFERALALGLVTTRTWCSKLLMGNI